MKVYLVENDAKVGEVYVLDRAPDQTTYEEDWVLYPNYQYPGPRFMGTLNVVPSPTERPYASQSEFFKNVPFAPGRVEIRTGHRPGILFTPGGA